MNNQITTILFLLMGLINYAQQNIVIDLSKNANDVITQNVSANSDLNIIIENKLPNGAYEISVDRKFELPEVLSSKKDSIGIKSLVEIQVCAEFMEKIDELMKITSEVQIPAAKEKLKEHLQQIKQELSAGNAATLESCTADHVFKGEQALEKTRMTLLPQRLKKGQSLEVTIKRKKEDDKFEVWKHIFATEKKGKWLTTYGFTYVSEIFKESESFFSKQTDTVFTVSALNKRSKLSFVPSIFFTWFPYKDYGKDFSHSLTAGMGYDLEAPTAFLGYSLLYNQNVGISIGISAHQQEFLNGKYQEGDILKENLERDQLNEKLYSLNPFISVSFRFGAAPFRTTEESDEE